MSAVLLSVLVLLLIAALAAVLLPLRGRPVGTADDAQRQHLSSEYQHAIAELSTLAHTPAGERRRAELEARAARNLRALDALPPAPRTPQEQRRAARLSYGAVAAALLLSVVGALSFIPRWQLAALAPAEAQAVQSALKLPSLQAAAQQAATPAAYLAWADAAFSAGRYPQASQGYAGALKLNPREARALRRLGLMLLTGQSGRVLDPQRDQTELQQAFLLVRTAAQLAPNDPESQLMLGYALNVVGESKLSLSALERYRTLNPQGRDADDLIATLRANLDKTDPATRLYASSCASCHGVSGGGGLGPSLRQSRLSRAELKGIIVSGKGAMPAFPELPASELGPLLTLLESWQQ